MTLSSKLYRDIAHMAECILVDGAIRVTKYFSPTEVVKATARRYNGKFVGKTREILYTIGRPNYAERKFIKDCLKAKEPFPIKGLQLKWAKHKLK